jgi:threonyl-tRNA synthetase
VKNNVELEKIRHSAAHLVAHAILELHPKTLLTIGPPTENGFFYDILPNINLKDADLPLLEQKMHEISERCLPITHEQMAKNQARILYANNPFKLELIDSIAGDTVGIARQGDFYDLCKGGHVEHTGQIQYFKLLHLSGSYWKANRSNQVLQRVSGTAFLSAQALAEWEQQKNDAQKYDHRKLGKELDLFSFHDEGVGFPFFHAKGKKVLTIMREYLQKVLDDNGYQEISTPIMLHDSLWKQSGHYEHYRKNMYFCQTIEEESYAIKPMNCPGAIVLYRERPRSYRELPLRLSEFGMVHRYELSGVLHGLFRVRAFTIDDGHIFCMPDQLNQEILTDVQTILNVLVKFGFNDISIKLATKPEHAIGSQQLWNEATDALINALETINHPYTIAEGDGAFYGPKIEYHIKDSMGRSWQCSTTQIDFFQPQRFDLAYTASSGKKEQPVMIHRAIYGSFERFFGILLEHYKGVLPFWLAPIQIKVLPITDAHAAYAQLVTNLLKNECLRVVMDTTSDPIAEKIKIALQEKIPWMVIIGKKEENNKTVTIRMHDGTQQFGLTIQELISMIPKQ